MRVREKVGIFDYQSGKSGNSLGILIHLLGMNPVISLAPLQTIGTSTIAL